MIDTRIAFVTLWSNAMVTVHTRAGEQLAEYQGRLDQVHAKILDAAPDDTRFLIGTWLKGTVPMAIEQFRCWEDLWHD